ncbi:carbon-nitrogen hydrolase family protein [Helicobacter valdiviensis]|uniref:Carbon-nitrogen hydrolase family protein n=1 Tax=Helicobacter valdiviensis TaxID=1458358 RepID=A0A2W6MXM7_9HELI|nr:carbon-nitrogen hydrolase family protein [Helicobacter valdiviensis]PZT49137.1 carbon-nitrogen hydrolase family protein [Helicobacter valdiviensis]
MKVGALQLGENKTQSELNAYLKAAYDQKVKVVVLGEYLLGDFFKNIENKDKKKFLNEIKSQHTMLLELSCKFPMTLVAPMIEGVGNKIYKSMAIINKGKALFYRSQRLMPYEHWNEAGFFDNTLPKNIKMPPVFKVGNLKFSVLFGYELHFDEFWLKFKQNQIDCVLLPSASTFDSSLRWRSIIKMRAFLNSCYILRANRIGQYEDVENKTTWNFYGDSLLVNPAGEVMDCLGDREELLIAEIDKKQLDLLKECWKFR